MPTTISLSLYMLQKASFLGAQGQPYFTAFVADGVAGALIGLCVVALLGFLPPWIAHAYGKRGLMVSVPLSSPGCRLRQNVTYHDNKSPVMTQNELKMCKSAIPGTY